LKGSLHLRAREHAVGELEGLRAGERLLDQTLELSALGQLVHDTLDDAVADERLRQLLWQRAGEDTVDDAGDLGRRQHVVGRRLDPPSPRARGEPCRVQRGPPGGVADPRPSLALTTGHGAPTGWH
jgi:hypothetical protein